MASNKFEGGKCHGAGDVKAALRHNDISPARRAVAAKENEHIDVTRSHLNVNLAGGSYAERCARYDARIAELDALPGANIRKDRVTGQLIETPVPAGLPREQYNAFLRRVLDIQKAQYGAENLISADIHWDEEHEYIDAETGEPRMSRVHLQAVWVPVKDGRLHGQAMYNRAGMRQLNAACQKMAAAEFGVDFMDGSGRQSKKSVRQLKAESAAAEILAKAEKQAAFTKSGARILGEAHRETVACEAEAQAAAIVQAAEQEATAIRGRTKAQEAAAAADRAEAAQELAAAQQARQEAQEAAAAAAQGAQAVAARLRDLTQAVFDDGFRGYVVSPKSGKTVGDYLDQWDKAYRARLLADMAREAHVRRRPQPQPKAPPEPAQEATPEPRPKRVLVGAKQARAEQIQRDAVSIWDRLEELPPLDPDKLREVK